MTEFHELSVDERCIKLKTPSLFGAALEDWIELSEPQCVNLTPVSKSQRS
jgi:hypothetical protein